MRGIRWLILLICCSVKFSGAASAAPETHMKAASIIEELTGENDPEKIAVQAKLLSEISLTDKEKDEIAIRYLDDLEKMLSRPEQAGKYEIIFFVGNLEKRAITLVPLLKKLEEEKVGLPFGKTFHGAIKPALSKILSP